jgi:hypothetical protein
MMIEAHEAMDRAEVVKLLLENICEISFTKADGTQRLMVGTLIEDYLEKTAGESVRPDNVVVLWDLEKDTWRSFRLDRLNWIVPAKAEIVAQHAI